MKPTEPPIDLPADPDRFYKAGPDIGALHAPENAAEPPSSALNQLGAPPFPKSKFPFLGFLASVYDHVASHARGRAITPSPAGRGPG